MTRDEKLQAAYWLKREGWTIAEIGDELGVTPSAVWKWLNPERVATWARRDNARRGPAKRAWEDTMRAKCSHCGGPLTMGSLKADGSQRRVKGERCATCIIDERVALVLEMWGLRRSEGLLNTAIAARLGVPVSTVRTELCRLRALGYDVPMSPYRGHERLPCRASVVDQSAATLGRALRAQGIHPTGRAA